MPSGLVRSFGIELLHEDVEAVLLLQSVRAWRPGCLLFEGKVHALVAAVLLWMAWLDALDRDTETKPPDREFGEVGSGFTKVRRRGHPPRQGDRSVWTMTTCANKS